MVESGVSFLKVVARKQSITKFVLYDKKKREAKLQDILSSIIPNEKRRFKTGECRDGQRSYPCIQLSPSSECCLAVFMHGSYTLLFICLSLCTCTAGQPTVRLVVFEYFSGYEIL